MLFNNLSVQNNTLYFAGMNTVELAKKYGTPLYLIDENYIENAMQNYKNTVLKYFTPNSSIAFASKSLSYVDIYRTAKNAGIYADTVSPGEIFTALKAGFDPAKIFFHGNNKTDTDIEYAIKNNIGYFVLDNLEEIEAVDRIAKQNNIKQKAILRLSPGIDPHTNKKVVTGNVDSKFGIAIETNQAFEVVKHILTKQNIDFLGFHCHIGSQIFDSEPFIDASKAMFNFVLKTKNDLGYTTKIVNLGGGFGVRYHESQPVLDIDKILSEVSSVIKNICGENDIPIPDIFFEPGRSIVAAAGMTLYSVGSKKTITGYKTYISIDGGMPDNPRYALYQSLYSAIIANNADSPRSITATIAGRCCESGDLIQEDVPMQDCKRGDILAVLVTGAYNYSMASNYNKLPRPPIVSIKNKTDRISVRRESFEDLAKNEL
ncbi:diaminopimelate decarboxylase [Eubacteriales bacterium OttesenSCG-928-G02]|nr:diaminopimelate decarboxylase [Eubacteriales bacterium OttesenSCG-928-G02]